MTATVAPARDVLATFVSALFRHADPETFISLRAFEDQKRDAPPIFTDGIRVDDHRLIDWTFNRANQAARHPRPAVFCPPCATFKDQARATEGDIANGVVLSVECDKQPGGARRKLVEILGEPTLTCASGGEWTNPDTGEIEPKLHLHWRLTEPTRTPEDHARLKRARRLACAIAGADATAVPLNHPLRWPGSVHRKGVPKLARILEQTDHEIELGQALDVLEFACPDPRESARSRFSEAFAQAEGEAGLSGDLLDIAAALAVIPNDDLTWDNWNAIGMAAWKASAGNAFAAFDAWSRKSSKYDAEATAARWQHYFRSPPDRIGAGTLYHLAKQTMPGWRKPSSYARDAQEDAGQASDAASDDQPREKAKASRSAKAPPGRSNGDPRPVVRLKVGELSTTVDDVEQAMIGASLGIYQRGGALVSTGIVPVITADRREVDCLQVVPLGEHALLERAMAAAAFEKWDARARDYVPANPPMTIIRTLEQRSGRYRFPVLAGIVNAPTLKADGNLLETPGYDAVTGLLFDPAGVSFAKVPDGPTKAYADVALAQIEQLISCFPFETDADRSVALSLILTSVVRRSLRTAPLHAFTAPVAGSGKTKLVDIGSVIATGREAGVVAMGGSAEELEKRLGALLLGGAAIAIDNCEGDVTSDLLCQLLTQTTVRPRILGHSQVPETPTNLMVTATGNNLRLAGDMTRRAILCRLDPKVERPELREFDFEPVQRAKDQRGDYVVAALTVLRAYHVVGRPRQSAPLGSFEDWSGLVRGSLLWLGRADPVDTMEQGRAADPRLEKLRAVMENWRTVIGSEPVTAAEVAQRASERHGHSVFDPGTKPAFQHPEFREALLMVAQAGGFIDAGKLGTWLGRIKGRVIEGCWFECDVYRKGVSTWTLRIERQPHHERAPNSSNAEASGSASPYF